MDTVSNVNIWQRLAVSADSRRMDEPDDQP